MSGIGTRRRGIGAQVSTVRRWKQRAASALHGMLLGLLIPTLALGQASLLPNAKQQYLDDVGNPVAGGQVFYYIPSTSTKKNVWLDAAERPQPTGQTYGSGVYRQKVVDANNLVIWDTVTSSTGSGGGGTNVPATGDGNLVGTILASPGWSLPNQYMYTDGHEVSRTTFPELLAAITQVTNAICTAGLPTLTGLPFSTTFQVPIGASVEASCMAPGSTVIAKATNSLTMSNNASISTAVSARIFFFGDGDRSTTFNLPDLRSSVPAGMDAMDVAVLARAVLIPPYFPANGLGAASLSPSTTLFLANFPPFTPAGTITNGTIVNTVTGGVNGATGVNTTVAAVGVQLLTGSTPIVVTSAQGTSTFVGTQVGSNTPISVVQPTMMLKYIIKVTPDTNSAQATGVLSLGGMTGALACGSNLTCTGNVVNTVSTSVNSPGSATPGNIAFWLDPAATTLGSAPSYLPANIANAALLSGVPNRTLGLLPTYNGFYFYQGAPITAIKQGGQDQLGLQQTLVASNSLAAGDNKAGVAIAAYAEANCPDPCNTVAIFGQAQANVAGGSISTANIVAQNIADSAAHGLDANFFQTMELNPNKWKNVGGTNTTVNGNHFYGLNIQGGGNHTDEIGSAIIINNSAAGNPARWATGLELFTGCCITGVSIGQVALGNNQGSQSLLFLSRDNSAVVRTATMFSDANGSLYAISSPSAAFVIQDGINIFAEFQSTAVIGGNTGLQLNQVVASGVLKTNASGIVSSSLTLPSGVIAPSFTVTTAFSAAGLLHVSDLATASQSTTVNGQVCALAGVCTVTASATSMAVGTTTVTGGTTTRVLFDNAGVLGEYAVSGTVNVAMTNGPTFVAPNLGTPASGAIATTLLTGTLQAAQEPAHIGDVTNTAGSLTLTIAANAVTLAKLATQATNTVLGNATSGSAVPTALAVGTCSTSSSALNWTTNTGFGCNTSINAATLGGATFAAPGAIGGGTPGTGAFTTLTASTSISSPIHTASGALTFQSNGSTFAGNITTGQQWYIGTTLNAPGSGVPLTISKNTAAPAVAAVAGTLLDLVQTDVSSARIALRQFGSSGGPGAIYYAAGGTAASPTQTLLNFPIGVNFGFAYGSGAYQTVAGSGFQMLALENCSSTACGSDFEIITTPAGTASQTAVAYFKQGLSVGSSTDPGSGKINAQSGFVAGGTAGITKTCTIAVGQILTFTLGILTATSGTAGCV